MLGSFSQCVVLEMSTVIVPVLNWHYNWSKVVAIPVWEGSGVAESVSSSCQAIRRVGPVEQKRKFVNVTAFIH